MLKSRTKQNILILGSNSDIATSLAIKLSNYNCNIILHYYKKKDLITKKKLKFHNFKIKADLRNKNEIDKMFKILKKKYKNLHFILSNFSTYDNPKKINKLVNYEKVFKTNFFGNINVLISYIKYFKFSKKKIMIVSSNTSLRGSATLPAYASSKASLDNLVKSFAKMYSSKNFQICSVIFGPVLTSKLILTKGYKWINNLKKKLHKKKLLSTDNTTNFIIKKIFTKENINGKNFKKFF